MFFQLILQNVFIVEKIKSKYKENKGVVAGFAYYGWDVDGTFKEGHVRIMDSRDQVLQRKTVRLVKVL